MTEVQIENAHYFRQMNTVTLIPKKYNALTSQYLITHTTYTYLTLSFISQILSIAFQMVVFHPSSGIAEAFTVPASC